MFTIAVCDDDMQERMQEVQIAKNIFSQKNWKPGLRNFRPDSIFRRLCTGFLTILFCLISKWARFQVLRLRRNYIK